MKQQPVLSEYAAYRIASIIKKEYEENPQLQQEFEEWKKTEEAKLYA